jgi:hypothetical protein
MFLLVQAYNDFALFAGAGGDPQYAIEGDLSPHSELCLGM